MCADGSKNVGQRLRYIKTLCSGIGNSVYRLLCHSLVRLVILFVNLLCEIFLMTFLMVPLCTKANAQ